MIRRDRDHRIIQLACSSEDFEDSTQVRMILFPPRRSSRPRVWPSVMKMTKLGRLSLSGRSDFVAPW
jgi:hypothetical protein